MPYYIMWLDVIKDWIKYILLIFFVIYVYVLFYYMDHDKEALLKHRYLYLIALLIPGLLALGVLFSTRISNLESAFLKGSVILKVVLVALMIYLYPYSVSTDYISSYFYPHKIAGLSLEVSFFVSLLLNFLFILINVIGLSLLYKLFLENSYQSQNFFVYLLFYIPCLVSDLIQYGLKEFKMTPNIVWVLFILEAVFLLLYLYIPSRLKWRQLSNGKCLLKDPVYLNKEKKILFQSTDIPFKVDDLSPKNTYAVSLWLSFNTLPVHEKNPVSILLFQCGSLQIDYTPNDHLQFQYCSTVTDKVPIPAQRWNHIVINYSDDMTVDLFVNGHLFRTNSLKGNTNCLGQNQTDLTLTTGSNNIDLHGAICNVTMYNVSLTESQIAEQYNILHLQNPPINNLS